MTTEDQQLIIVGAGGHGREALDVALDCGLFEVAGFVAEDKPPQDMLDKYRIAWLGKSGYLLNRRYSYVLAIGDCKDKKKMSDIISKSSCVPINLLHPSAYIGSHCKLGHGVMMYPGSKITTNVTLGNHVHLNVNSVVSHDCSVGDFSIVSPGVLLNGNVSIGNGVFIGTGAIVLPKITVGDGVTIGAGAVVTKDIPPYETYVGIPARRI